LGPRSIREARRRRRGQPDRAVWPPRHTQNRGPQSEASLLPNELSVTTTAASSPSSSRTRSSPPVRSRCRSPAGRTTIRG
jgi:hypothetical protein